SAVALNKIPHAVNSKRLVRIAQAPLRPHARNLAFRAPISSTSTVNCVVALAWAHLYTGAHADRTELFIGFRGIGFSLWVLGLARTKLAQAEAYATGFRKLIV
ncbi:MAG TPA: hypothetical protein VG272_02950, partial [Candidatus Acidoferrales bacterium]|nr:hypothetical protein [Candidatus Acidoferrales bacterium]